MLSSQPDALNVVEQVSYLFVPIRSSQFARAVAASSSTFTRQLASRHQRSSVAVRRKEFVKCELSAAFEILHFSLVLLGLGPGGKRSQISPSAGLRACLTGV
jgi:hypothetical protein